MAKQKNTIKKSSKKIPTEKQLSNASSSGGLGFNFESKVQSSFVLLMLTRGIFPCLSTWPITKIELQSRYRGFKIDDIIAYSEHPNTKKQKKLLGQIKHSLAFTNKNKEFTEVIQAAWSDFNNKAKFTEGTDIISLICGPLSATDTNDVRILLEQARESFDVEDFNNRIQQGKFSSDAQRKKLRIFKYQLKKANNNIEPDQELLWRFLKSFYVFIYDLDIKGVTLSLLHTIIEQHSCENSNSIWCQIKDFVQEKNQRAGFITIEKIPEEISSVFKIEKLREIPIEFAKETKVLTLHKYAHELAIACLIGSWDEKSKEDQFIVSKIAQEEYNSYIAKLREVVNSNDPNCPITLKNGTIWKFKNRLELFFEISSSIFDADLDCLKESAILALKEYDPKFDLEKELRFSAQIYDKIPKYSYTLKEALAEGLALIGSYSKYLKNCSKDKAELVIMQILSEIFKEASWQLWASLNQILPLLAESSPSIFISILEDNLQKNPNIFIELFNQEGDGITGGCYMTGLLWALEGLAWSDDLLLNVTTILGELAQLDPGGKWSNRPFASLGTIFIPWYPQTTATIEKRKLAIKTLNKEYPEVAWKLLINLLPEAHQTTGNSHKPVFRKFIPDDWKEVVTNKDYYEQVSFYSDFLVEQAKDNIEKLDELIDKIDDLPKQSFEKILKYLSSDNIISSEEDKKLNLWKNLTNFILQHKRFSTAEWALKPELILEVEKVAKLIEPTDPINLYSRLFCDKAYYLFEENDNWEEQIQKLEERRQEALRNILSENDNFDAIIKLINKVESANYVGWSFGKISDNTYDKFIIPKMLIDKDEKFKNFASAYVCSKYLEKGWNWIDHININKWGIKEISSLFICLPFTPETWSRIRKLSKELEAEYWQNVNTNPYERDTDLNFAIRKLLEYNRPKATIACIHNLIKENKKIDNKTIVNALNTALVSPEPRNSMYSYYVVEIIKKLQEDEKVKEEDLILIEWQYLALLEHSNGAEAKTLENCLANNPDFFCQIIRSVYKSKNDIHKEYKPTEQETAMMKHAWDLLDEWHTPPGQQKDGSFFSESFNNWFDSVVKSCTDSGHLDVALSWIGKILYYAPKDKDGFWKDKAVLEVLNKKEYEPMRRGFNTEVINSRGCHFVDPTGKPEKELAAKYQKLAEDTESEGFQRFATTLKDIANFYEKEAERIIIEHSEQ